MRVLKILMLLVVLGICCSNLYGCKDSVPQANSSIESSAGSTANSESSNSSSSDAAQEFLEQVVGSEIQDSSEIIITDDLSSSTPQQVTSKNESSQKTETSSKVSSQKENTSSRVTSQKTENVSSKTETTVSSKPTQNTVTTAKPSYKPSKIELELLDLMNQARVENNLKKLTFNTDIYECALIRANEVKTLWSHTRPNGTNFNTVFDDCKIKVNGYLGENLGRYFKTAESIFEALMNSQGHRQNILHTKFTSVSIAIVEDGNGYYCMAQLFFGPA